MHSRPLVGLLALVLATLSSGDPLSAAGPPIRRSLDSKEREAVLSLLKAVDLAQEVDAASDAALTWANHAFKSADQTAYVPFRIHMKGVSDAFKSAAMYVRAVSRRDGTRASEERSYLRDWLVRGGGVPPRPAETVYLGAGEMPVGLAAGSSRPSISAPGGASTALALQERQYEKERVAASEAKKKREAKERDPLVFPFEEYYFVDLKPGPAGDLRAIERALALPPGEYDVFVALVDRARVKSSSPVILKQSVSVPDFWNDQLVLSSLILAREVRELKAPVSAQQQAEHPYAFGLAEMVPVVAPDFATDDVLRVVFQMCNYGAPDADLSAEYTFYRVDGERRLFNRTEPQQFSDADLPALPPGTQKRSRCRPCRCSNSRRGGTSSRWRCGIV